MRTPRFSSDLLRFLAAAAVALALAACTPRIDTRGNLPDPDKLADIKPGEVSRDEVAEILGTPSSTAIFGNEVWYYISERTETTAFFAPEVKERQVVIVRFDKDGIVSRVETVGLESARAIEPVERETPTPGKEMTILQQLIGNLGRFNKAAR